MTLYIPHSNANIRLNSDIFWKSDVLLAKISKKSDFCHILPSLFFDEYARNCEKNGFISNNLEKNGHKWGIKTVNFRSDPTGVIKLV